MSTETDETFMEYTQIPHGIRGFHERKFMRQTFYDKYFKPTMLWIFLIMHKNMRLLDYPSSLRDSDFKRYLELPKGITLRREDFGTTFPIRFTVNIDAEEEGEEGEDPLDGVIEGLPPTLEVLESPVFTTKGSKGGSRRLAPSKDMSSLWKPKSRGHPQNIPYIISQEFIKTKIIDTFNYFSYTAEYIKEMLTEVIGTYRITLFSGLYSKENIDLILNEKYDIISYKIMKAYVMGGDYEYGYGFGLSGINFLGMRYEDTIGICDLLQ